MPIYEYKCGACLHKYEMRKGFSEDSIAACPICQGEGQRLFSPVPIIFKGSGFYVTDYKKEENNGSQCETEESGPKAESTAPVKSSQEDGHGED